MTKPEPIKPRRYLRTAEEYRWTRPKIAEFLRQLAATGKVAKAARAVGMNRQAAYDLRGRMHKEHGPAFGRLWDEAEAIAVDRQVDAAIARMEEDKRRRYTAMLKAIRASRQIQHFPLDTVNPSTPCQDSAPVRPPSVHADVALSFPLRHIRGHGRTRHPPRT